MAAVQGQSQAIGELIESLGENGMAICTSEDELRGTYFYPVLDSSEQLLAPHFAVDLNVVEREHRQVLAEFAQRQAAQA